jgi:hypothetical protein
LFRASFFFLFPQTALLILFPASTWTGVVAADFLHIHAPFFSSSRFLSSPQEFLDFQRQRAFVNNQAIDGEACDGKREDSPGFFD